MFMSLSRCTCLQLAVLAGLCGCTVSMELPKQPPGGHFPLTARDHASAGTFVQGDPVIATTYFYWYDIKTQSHIIDHDGTDALTTHPADMNDMSFRSVAWHKRQFRDMIDAGIDVLMPVYWGVPGDYKAWSFVGLPPMVEARRALQSEGLKPPAVGLFYDTSIMLWNAFDGGRSYHVDLTTEFGREWFYTAIRDFFSLIPPGDWARIDGSPIVFLYGANFAKAQDPRALAHAQRRFEEDFGVRMFLVKNADWQGESDAAYSWGGAVNGPLIFRETVSLGPGYDHSAVPGRSPLIVERLDGKTYIDRWTTALRLNPRHRPWLVHVETWNEWHEGTDIADSREYGRSYIVLTRLFADLWHGRVSLRFGEFLSSDALLCWTPGQSKGLKIRPSGGDGVWRPVVVDGVDAVVSQAGETAGRYLYFDVDEAVAFELYDKTVRVVVTYRDSGCSAIQMQYDNTDASKGPGEGAFRPNATISVGDGGQWKTAEFTLEQCRFMNRDNGADFRLAVLGSPGELTVREVTLKRID